jgi:Uma2 family endonuclease
MSAATLTSPQPAHRCEPFPRPWTPAEFQTIQALGLFPGRAIALVGGQVVETVAGQPSPRPILFSRAEYHALDAVRLFRGQRVQLLRGVVVQESPMLPPHATGVRKVTKQLELAFPSGVDVRPQLPLDLGLITEPLPDVAVVTGSIDDFAVEHPKFSLLVVEVAEATLFEDTTTKAELYAEAGINDYWVLDLDNRRLLVFRDPAPVAAGGHAYRTHKTFGPGDTLAPLAAPNSPVRVADLLP